MNLDLIREASPAIKIHLATVIPAFALGTWLVFVSRKGARWHRVLGAVYLALMLTTAVATYFVRALNHGHLSFIHLFIPLTLFGVFGGLWAVLKGQIASHQRAMLALYVGIVAAGALAFLPGRLMWRAFFG